MTAPEPRPGGADGNARGLMVLGVGLIVGFLLLFSAGNDNGTVDASDIGSPPNTTAPLGGTTTTAAGSVTTTTAASTRAPGEVKVVVLNGGGPSGAAETTSNTIGDSGYVMGTFGNWPAGVESTTVFYAEGYQAEAIAIAAVLGKDSNATQPITDEVAAVDPEANVVVVLGPDAPPVESSDSGETTTTTAAN